MPGHASRIVRTFSDLILTTSAKRRSGLPSAIGFGHKFGGYRRRRFHSSQGTAPTEECFQESVYETNGRPQQASRSRNGPVRAGPDAQTPAQAALDRQGKRS